MSGDQENVEFKMRLETVEKGFAAQQLILKAISIDVGTITTNQLQNDITITGLLKDMEKHCDKVNKILEGNGHKGLIKESVLAKEQIGVLKDKLNWLVGGIASLAVIVTSNIVFMLVTHFLSK